jgi:2-hydroxychromene-2-carboxylate isomerase
MAAPIDFYFDFSSPYGYIGSEVVDAFAARIGRDVAWRPVLLGPIFKHVGTAPLVDIPLKGDYAKRDFVRMARYYKVPFTLPVKFPVGTQAATRAFYCLSDADPALARRFAKQVFRAYYTDGIDISDPATVVELAAKVGADREKVAAAIADPAVKERVKNEVDAAIAKGVFGSPLFIVDGEMFWGVDRLPQLEEWVRTGGW